VSRSFLKELSLVAGLSIVGFAGTASARPDGLPPGTIRNDISLRAMPDGRGGGETRGESGMRVFQEARVRPDSAVLPREKQLPIPIKNDILMQVSSGGESEGASKSSRIQTDPNQASRPSSLILPGRERNPAPIKNDILMQVQVMKYDGNSSGASSSGGGRGSKSNALNKMSNRDKDEVCKHTGICAPKDNASSDSEDKAR
jgi:hypothetical protein